MKEGKLTAAPHVTARHNGGAAGHQSVAHLYGEMTLMTGECQSLTIVYKRIARYGV